MLEKNDIFKIFFLLTFFSNCFSEKLPSGSESFVGKKFYIDLNEKKYAIAYMSLSEEIKNKVTYDDFLQLMKVREKRLGYSSVKSVGIVSQFFESKPKEENPSTWEAIVVTRSQLNQVIREEISVGSGFEILRYISKQEKNGEIPTDFEFGPFGLNETEENLLGQQEKKETEIYSQIKESGYYDKETFFFHPVAFNASLCKLKNVEILKDLGIKTKANDKELYFYDGKSYRQLEKIDCLNFGLACQNVADQINYLILYFKNPTEKIILRVTYRKKQISLISLTVFQKHELAKTTFVDGVSGGCL
ncbi:hypothetical protein [Leptospira koniambonensis]|uniref:hypothetical protein n=1 Tax=Leptospira koniambonensis TaxID=2484950 RepID=UPI003EBF4B94